MSLTAYIRYDNTGRIVPGGPMLLSTKPTVGNWQAVQTTAVPSVTLSGKLRAFIKLNGQNKIVASSLVLAKSKPATGKWIEVNATYEGPVSPTTTTTTTVSPSTTTTTTTLGQVYSFSINYVGKIQGADYACTMYLAGPIITMYSNVATLVQGSILYNNPQLTDPFSGYGTEAWYALDNNGTICSTQIGRISDGNTGLILYTPIPCASLYPSYEVTNYNNYTDACQGTNPGNTTTVYASSANRNFGTILWTDPAGTQQYNPGTSVIKFSDLSFLAYSISIGSTETTISGNQFC